MAAVAKGWATALALAVSVTCVTGVAAAEAPLVLEAKILLGAVSGRIDHLAADVRRQRLFVAELGNDSLGVIDLAAGKVLHTITELSEPQGVGYEPSTDAVYVANAGDGSVRVFRGEDFAPIGRIDLGDDADNVRVDLPQKRVLIGYGKGAVAVIDPAKQIKAAEFRLSGHPEGFQIDSSGTQIYVNVPDSRELAIVDPFNAKVRSRGYYRGTAREFPDGG